MNNTEIEPVVAVIENGIHMVTIMNPMTGRAESTHGAFLSYIDASAFLIEEGFSVSYTGLEGEGEEPLAFTKHDSEHPGLVTMYALIETYAIQGLKGNKYSFNDTEEIIELSYDFPFNDEEVINKHNELWKDSKGFKPLLSFEDELLNNLNDIRDKIYDIGDEKGWFQGEGVLAKVYLQYDPENK